MNAMDSFLPFLFGFHNKALAFVDKISTGDSKSFEIHSQVFFLSFITWREKKLLYEETVSTSALLFNTRNQDYAQIKKACKLIYSFGLDLLFTNSSVNSNSAWCAIFSA